MDDKSLLMFSRQILMPSIGVDGQNALFDTCVLIFGAGGLGCSIAQSIVGSGIGELVIVDDDVIELSNLPRQFMFFESDIGKSKSVVLCDRLQDRLPVKCTAISKKYSDKLMVDVVSKYRPKIIVDAGDNMSLSLDLDRASSIYNLPLVHASVIRFEGYVYTKMPTSCFPTLRELFPRDSVTETCSQTGVLTVSVVMIASCQAIQVLKVALSPLLGDIVPEIFLFDGNGMRLIPLKVGK